MRRRIPGETMATAPLNHGTSPTRGAVAMPEPEPEATVEDATGSWADPDADVRDPLTALRPGEEITITRGPEVYTPVQYNSIAVGPFAVKVVVHAGETGRVAFDRGLAALDQIFAREVHSRIPAHIERAKSLKR